MNTKALLARTISIGAGCAILAALEGCGFQPFPQHGGMEEDQGCIESESAIRDNAPTSEDELRAVIDTFAPIEVVWDRSPSSDASSPIDLTLSPSGPAVVVQRSGEGFGCRLGPELRIPVDVSLNVPAGLTVAFASTVDALGSSADDIYLPPLPTSDVRLSPEWVELADEVVLERSPEAGGAAVELELSGPLAGLQLSLTGRPEDGDGGVIVLWSGSVQE